MPVQWSAWLSHTRLRPPTTEELETDQVRQIQVQRNALLLDAHEQDKRAEMHRLRTASPVSNINTARITASQLPEQRLPGVEDKEGLQMENAIQDSVAVAHSRSWKPRADDNDRTVFPDMETRVER